MHVAGWALPKVNPKTKLPLIEKRKRNSPIMRFALAYAALLSTLAACGGSQPSVAPSNLGKEKISLLFEFLQGSSCSVETSQGTIVQATMPGKIEFSNADREAPAQCVFPDGRTVRITAHNRVPENSKVAGITVYPDGRAFITSSTRDGQLLQLQTFGAVSGG